MKTLPALPSPAVRADALLLFITCFWGLSFVIIKAALEQAPPLLLMTVRFVLAVALVWALAWRRPASPGLARDGALLGLLLGGGMALQICGQLTTTASKAAFLTGISVPLTPLAAWLRTGALPSRAHAAGVALATAGFCLLAWPADGAGFERGDLLGLACSVVFAFYVVEMSLRTSRHDALRLTAVQLTAVLVVAAAAAVIVALFASPGWRALAVPAGPLDWTGRLGWSIAYLGTAGTVGTFLGVTWAQRHMSATHAALIYALEPVAATALGAWFLGERLAPGGFAGCALILAGILVSELQRKARAASTSRMQ